jgi:hypothetical protein
MPVTETAPKVINVQEGVRFCAYWIDVDIPHLPNPLQAIFDDAREQDIPLVVVFNIADEPLMLTSGRARALNGLNLTSSDRIGR